MSKDLWISILERVKPTISRAHFLTWFQNTNVVANDEGVVKVGVPTTYALNWISTKYDLKILQAAQEIESDVKRIDYEVRGSLSDGGKGVDVKSLFKDDDKKVRKVRNVQEVSVSKGGVRIQSGLMNSRYRLSNYVVGKDNRLPHAACLAVSNEPGGIYNPLYIYGSTGLGKTHLLQAIGNETLKNYSDKVVKYMTAEQFVTEVVEAIGKRYTKSFKDKYRKVDVLLIDDIQFFARKHSSQQEFFHTFNELYNANKQVVITSDRSPSELDDLDSRLKDRFAMGMVVELLFPDFETRLAILHQKCREFQIILDPDVMEFIANNVHNNVRELEGVLRQVVAEMRISGCVPTIRSAASIIQRLNKAQEIIGYNIEQGGSGATEAATCGQDIMQAAANYFGLTVADLIGPARKKEIMKARQISMYIIKSELGYSYGKIGDDFGKRNHSTVMHSCSKTEKALKNDPLWVKDIAAIKRQIGM